MGSLQFFLDTLSRELPSLDSEQWRGDSITFPVSYNAKGHRVWYFAECDVELKNGKIVALRDLRPDDNVVELVLFGVFQCGSELEIDYYYATDLLEENLYPAKRQSCRTLRQLKGKAACFNRL